MNTTQPIQRGSAPPSTRKPMLTAGGVLKARRKELGYSLKKVADETKVRKDYLMYIENNDFERFESKVFANGFIKIYADYVGLDENKVTALYRRSIDENFKVLQPVAERSIRPKFSLDLEKLITPANGIAAIVLVFVITLLSYLAIQFYEFSKAPNLSVSTPITSTTVKEADLVITGTTEEGTTVLINDTEINVEEDFTFSYKIRLIEGPNTITVKAVKKGNTNSEALQTLEIKYEPEISEKETTGASKPIPEGYTARLRVVGGEAWIVLTIDGKQKVAEILPGGYSKDFEFTEDLYISSGRPSNTKLSINGENIEITVDSQTGTATTSCSIRSTGYTCN